MLTIPWHGFAMNALNVFGYRRLPLLPDSAVRYLQMWLEITSNPSGESTYHLYSGRPKYPSLLQPAVDSLPSQLLAALPHVVHQQHARFAMLPQAHRVKSAPSVPQQ